jgi:hypothetical protein
MKNVLNESSEGKCNTFYEQYRFSVSCTVFEIKRDALPVIQYSLPCRLM